MLLLISLLVATVSGPAQDEVVRTSPPAVTATARQDCMFGGQPVACPQPVSVASSPVTNRVAGAEGEDENPWNAAMNANFGNTTTNQPSQPGPVEGSYSRSPRIRGTASFDPNAAQPTTPARPRVFVSESVENGTRVPATASGSTATVDAAAPSFDWSAGARNGGSRAPYPALEYMTGFYTADGAPTDTDAVPPWAFDDPERYELDQCGSGAREPSDPCRRIARNRLAMARAEAAISDERIRDPDGSQASGSRCRTVNEPGRNGMPASSSLVCGNGDTDALLDNMRERATRVTTPGL